MMKEKKYDSRRSCMNERSEKKQGGKISLFIMTGVGIDQKQLIPYLEALVPKLLIYKQVVFESPCFNSHEVQKLDYAQF